VRSPATRDALSIAPLMLMIGRPQTCKLARNPVLRGYVADRLRQDWSPQQIAGVLAKHFSAGSRMRVSHETIYKSLFIQSRGGLAKELQKHLRSGRPIRRSVHNTLKGQWRSQITEARADSCLTDVQT